MKPPLKRDPDWLNQILNADSEVIALFIDPEHARYIVAAVNACHAGGLTLEQLEAGVITNLVNLEKTFSDFCQQQSDATQPDSAAP